MNKSLSKELRGENRGGGNKTTENFDKAIRKGNKKIKKQRVIKIATLNVRSLKDEYKFLEIEKEFEKSEIDMLGLAEVRRKNETILETKKGKIWFYTGHREMGFLVSNKLKKSIKEFVNINDRIAIVELEIKREKVIIIQVHAPTMGSTIEELEEFYKTLNNVTDERSINKQNKIIIMGDFNSQIGIKKGRGGIRNYWPL